MNIINYSNLFDKEIDENSCLMETLKHFTKNDLASSPENIIQLVLNGKRYLNSKSIFFTCVKLFEEIVIYLLRKKMGMTVLNLEKIKVFPFDYKIILENVVDGLFGIDCCCNLHRSIKENLIKFPSTNKYRCEDAKYAKELIFSIPEEPVSDNDESSSEILQGKMTEINYITASHLGVRDKIESVNTFNYTIDLRYMTLTVECKVFTIVDNNSFVLDGKTFKEIN